MKLFSRNMNVLVLLCLGFDLASSAIVFGFGGCPSVTTKADFVLSTYVGTWYEYQRFNNWFERNLKCVSAKYTDNGDGSIKVENAGINIDNGEAETIEGKATVPDSNKPGELKVSFSAFDFTRGANYLILDTDYTSYALVFSCSGFRFLPFTFQTAWILTRARGVSPVNLESLYSTLNSYGIPSSKLKSTTQTGC